MTYQNILKCLQKKGYIITPMQFNHKPCVGVNGTALIDITNGEVTETTAKLNDVLLQIVQNKSHIYNVENKKKRLSPYQKLNTGTF